VNTDLTHNPSLRRVLGAAAVATLAGAGALAFTPAAQAATVSGRPNAPMAHVALHETITIPAGASKVTGTSGSTHFTISRPAKLSPETESCSLTVYGPYWAYEAPPSPNYVTVAASISCPEKISDISISVGLYDGVSGILLSANYNVDYNTTFDYVQDNYPISEDGYYIAGAVANTSTPDNTGYGEDYSPDTYVIPVEG
jgi:hypothetical protein